MNTQKVFVLYQELRPHIGRELARASSLEEAHKKASELGTFVSIYSYDMLDQRIFNEQFVEAL